MINRKDIIKESMDATITKDRSKNLLYEIAKIAQKNAVEYTINYLYEKDLIYFDDHLGEFLIKKEAKDQLFKEIDND